MAVENPIGPHPEIGVATVADAQAMAALWAVVAPESVWTGLGPRLAEIYFRRFCQGGHELAVIAKLDGHLVGGCVGTDRPDRYRLAFYRRYGPELISALWRELLARPMLVTVLIRRAGQMVRARLGRGAARTGDSPLPADTLHARWCYMSDFFVAPSARGRRLGTLMLERFCEEMARRGCEVCLVHTTAENRASQAAQERAGFACVNRDGSDLLYMRRLVQ